MTTAVIALGKIGLPLALQITSKGQHVIGADINQDVVNLVNDGIEPFPGETDLQENLDHAISKNLLTATTNTVEAVSKSKEIIVVVPVIVDNDGIPDFSMIDSATAEIAKGLQPGTLISYETTLPIGTTRNRFKPELEKISNLTCGEDFFLCHSPERVFSGRIFADLRKYPKLVGGTDEKSNDLAVEFYERILDFDDRPDLERANGVWNLGSSEAAEMAKLAETTYRNVNIALANEFALHAQDLGLDVFSVIEASNSQPFSHIHLPGVAVGGHCIPVYPKFYMHTDTSSKIPKVSTQINEAMPQRVIDLAENYIGSLKGLTVAIFGVSYRGGVKETAFSGAFPLVEEITNRGGKAKVHDPLYSESEIRSLGLVPHETYES
ncbi:MAG: nucleotide sugar dehydrogenase, partial [Acidimicrobiales bacterium]|nr:nucleotide sugar dehydrogenase [Acidimicrobiales bacterium]